MSLKPLQLLRLRPKNQPEKNNSPDPRKKERPERAFLFACRLRCGLVFPLQASLRCLPANLVPDAKVMERSSTGGPLDFYQILIRSSGFLYSLSPGFTSKALYQESMLTGAPMVR